MHPEEDILDGRSCERLPIHPIVMVKARFACRPDIVGATAPHGAESAFDDEAAIVRRFGLGDAHPRAIDVPS
jgi:hypothetical protein